MDPISIIGFALAAAAIIISVILEGGSPSAMILMPPMILVFFGTFGVAMAGYTMADMKRIPKYTMLGLTQGNVNVGSSVDTLVKMAERARRDGLLALEDAARDVEDPFLKRGLELAIDGTDSEQVQEILEAEVGAHRAQGNRGAKFYMDMGGYAPTIGIIGTVNGLIHVLENLSEPAKLGHLIAAAFVATLWGVMSANVMWLPMGNKIKRVVELECQQREVIIEGIMAIQSGANPRMVDRKLRALLQQPPPNPTAKAA
jgi:chemotaxis protein MotA